MSSMKLFQKKPDRFERMHNEIIEIGQMLQEKGEYDGKCRYLEIMAIILLFIDNSLSVIRSVLFAGAGVIAGLLISGMLAKIF